MSGLGRTTFAKRQKEQARAERQREKAVERARRAEERRNKPATPPGVDPDLVGIVPGPQPSSDA